jgi:hypothetical protein
MLSNKISMSMRGVQHLKPLARASIANGREGQLEVSIPLDMDAGTLDNMLCYIPCPLQSNESHPKGIY